jgi:hypothetical protein
MKKNIISLIVISIVLISLNAQRAIIPFYITKYNRIILKYPIKNKTVDLFFDTGWSFNLLDVNIARELNIPNGKLNFADSNIYKVDSIFTMENVGIEIIFCLGIQKYKQDSVFYGGWMYTDMKKTADALKIGADVVGVVGYESDFTMELDFQNNTLKVWDSLPTKYLLDPKIKKVKLVDSDFGGTYKYKIGMNPLCMKSELTVLDTLVLHPNLLIDTGTSTYAIMKIFDSLLYNNLVEFKKKKGDLYPTTKLRIPELGIDTSFLKLKVINKLQVNKDRINPYRGPIGGLLGVSFLRQYHRVVFNRKMQIALFED